MSIQFTCPKCGTASTVADSYAGQTGPCANCGASVTIPGGFASQPAKKSNSGVTILIVLAVCAAMCLPCGGIGVALLLPAVQSAREAARRMACQNNLKQIGLALHNYASTNGSFPPAYLADENGQPMHSWRVLLLPYMEQQGLYSQYNFEEPWDGPNNSLLAMDVPPPFVCPSDPSGGCAYQVINVPDGIFDGPNATNFGSITDGLSTTIMVVEAVGSLQDWTDPTFNLDATALQSPVNATRDGTTISSYHPGGAMVLRADGSVFFLSEKLTQQTISDMTTKSDGQAINIPY